MKKTLTLVAAVLLVMAIALPSAFAAVEIDVWTPLSGSKAKTFDALVDAFNQSQSDVKVNSISQGSYNVLRQKMTGAYNAKAMPAMVVADYIDVPLYAQRNMLTPMNEILSEDVLSDFFPGMMADLTQDGVIYAVPYNRTTQGFIVNNDLLAQAGIERVASTWDEFYEDAVAFKAAMGEEYYYGFAFFNQYIFDAIAYSFGVTMASEDGIVNLNTPEMNEMFSFFRKMYEENLLVMVPTLSGSFAEQFSPFLEGKVATVFQSSSFLSSAQTLLTCDWSFEYMPAGKAGSAITIGGTNIGVSATATDEEKAAAKLFLEFITSAESGAKVFMETANLPVRQSTLALPEVALFMANNEWTGNLLSQLDNGKSASIITKNIGDIYNLANDMIVRIIYNGEDIEEVLNEYTAVFQDTIDEKKEAEEFVF